MLQEPTRPNTTKTPRRKSNGSNGSPPLAPAKKRVSPERQDANAKFEAIAQAQPLVEFDPAGTVVNANEKFLALVGRSLTDLQDRT